MKMAMSNVGMSLRRLICSKQKITETEASSTNTTFLLCRATGARMQNNRIWSKPSATIEKWCGGGRRSDEHSRACPSLPVAKTDGKSGRADVEADRDGADAGEPRTAG